MLYLNYPKDTIEIENDGVKKCICDNNKYCYSERGSNGNTVIYYELDEYPTNKPYKNEGDENECLTSC